MEKITSRDGTTIAFDRSGEGPPVILVGGAFQQRAGDERTAQLAALLAPRFTVYHYDRRGRGDSGDTLPYAVEREVEDLGALIEVAGGSAFLFGMSSGGALGLAAAARGLAVERLALYEVPYNVDASALPAALSYSRQLNALLAEGRRGDAAALAMTRFGAPAEAVEGMRQAPFWAGIESIAPTLAYDDAIMGDCSLPTDWLASVAVPTLVVDGGASPEWMRDAARALAEALPDARRLTLEGQTHAYAPEVLAPALARFFST